MNILGFNPGHHGSVCLLQDGELTHFIQEERVTRHKYDAYPFKSFIDIIQNYKIDYITLATPSIYFPLCNLEKKEYSYWWKLASSYHHKVTSRDYSNPFHHTSHTAHAFYNSGFKEAIGVVVDGLGSVYRDKDNKSLGQECETIFECSYPSNFKVLFKNIVQTTTILEGNPDNNDFDFEYNHSENINLSRVYETVTMHLGWLRDEAGKTMGLAPYGKHNPNIPQLFKNQVSSPDIILNDLDKPSPYLKNYHPGNFFNEEKYPQLKLQRDPREWHHDESKITDLEKDLAWQVQNDTQQIVGDYIEKAIQKTGFKQVCCAGGYFLNCVTNYYLQKRFPDIEFYFEPIANDAGTAIGAAKLTWHQLTQDTTIRPFKSLYLGKQYSKDELLEGIKKYT